ncbi:MAG: Uma2 family endonuclease, partial [Pirellulales bacterium]|nr:Uma2 family endonuclease [Pirellulales bacterium]
MLKILESPAVRDMAMPMSVEQYHRLSEAGIVPERTELLRGVIIEKMTKSPLHVYVVSRMFDWLSSAFEDDGGRHVRKEHPLTLSDSEVEPDVAVVVGSIADFRTAHPTTADFVAEVSVSSYSLDREKGAVYAAAGVPEYWIVIPEQRAIEIYTSP